MDDIFWEKWIQYLSQLGITDPLLIGWNDPIPLLLVFAQRMRSGAYATRGQPVGHAQVAAALRSIGQTMASMGARDVRLLPNNRLEYRLKQLLDSYHRFDPEPTRVSPVPIAVL